MKAYHADGVRRDILEFWKSPLLSLDEYALAAGREPEPGVDGKLQWLVPFLSADETAAVKNRSALHADRLAGLASLAVFPPDAVEAVAWVTPGTLVVKVEPAREGRPGMDVFGKPIPAPRGVEAELRLFEGLRQEEGAVAATAAGILEKGSVGMAVRLRVRPHRDAALSVAVTADRMAASVTCTPFEGTGEPVSPDELKAGLARAGVVQGIDPDRLLSVLDAVRKNAPVPGVVVARGEEAGTLVDRMTVHVRVASGKSVAVREDGGADFREQDKITRVAKGDLLVTLRPAAEAAVDGWDVTGSVIPAALGGGAVAGCRGARQRGLRPGRQHALSRRDRRRAGHGRGPHRGAPGPRDRARRRAGAPATSASPARCAWEGPCSRPPPWSLMQISVQEAAQAAGARRGGSMIDWIKGRRRRSRAGGITAGSASRPSFCAAVTCASTARCCRLTCTSRWSKRTRAASWGGCACCRDCGAEPWLPPARPRWRPSRAGRPAAGEKSRGAGRRSRSEGAHRAAEHGDADARAGVAALKERRRRGDLL